jgi:hypothetical protein
VGKGSQLGEGEPSRAWQKIEQLILASCWVSWGREFCPAAVIREAEAEAEETWQHTKTPSSTQAVSAVLAPDAWLTEDASMEPVEDTQEAGMRRSTRARKATARGKAAVQSLAPSSSDDAKTAEQAGSAATVAEDLDKVADNSGDEGGESAKLHGAADARGASTTSTASLKRPVEDEDVETPASKRTRSDMVMPGESKRGRKPYPEQEPQTVSCMREWAPGLMQYGYG